jgi:hypothetical protein
VHGDDVCQLAVKSVHRADYAVAEIYRTSHDRVEGGLDGGRRAGDHAQDFTGRSLLLACLVSLAGEPRDLCFLAGR